MVRGTAPLAFLPKHSKARTHLLLPLLPGELHRVGVNHDDVVTAVVVRAECRLVFSAKDRRDLAGQPADDLETSQKEKRRVLHERYVCCIGGRTLRSQLRYHVVAFFDWPVSEALVG